MRRIRSTLRLAVNRLPSPLHRGWSQTWSAAFAGWIEPSPDGSRRLSRQGQLALAGGVLMGGLLLYALSWRVMTRMSEHWRLCVPLDQPGLMQEQTRQTLNLADGLRSATPSQKLRLRQQIEELTTRLDGLCWMVIHYRNNQAALLMVATASGSLLSLALAVGLPQGVLHLRNRVLQTLLVSNAFLLLFAVALLQLSEVERNLQSNLLLMRRHRELLQRLQTALANQELLAPTAAALDTPSRVATLIRSQDRALQALPMIGIHFNESMALEWANKLGEGGEPAGGSGTAPAAAEAGSAIRP